MRPMFAVLAVVVVFCTVVKVGSAAIHLTKQAHATQQRALCSTDSDCAKLCRADDVECDGGPQS